MSRSVMALHQQLRIEDLLARIYIHPALAKLVCDAVRDARDQLVARTGH